MFAESEKRHQESVYGTITCFVMIIAIGLVTQSVLLICLLVFCVSLPVWLPYLIIRIRYIIFEKINGEEGVQIPSEKYDDKIFRYLYNHPSVNLRSKQNNVGLSDFFWYLLAPAHYIHQEHLESDTLKYKILKQVTKSIISKPNSSLISFADKYINSLFNDITKPKLVHLRQFFFTAFLKIFYELTFGQELTDQNEIKIIYDSANDVITALKFLKIRNMKTRHKLTEFLYNKIKTETDNDIYNTHFKSDKSKHVTDKERALYLQGVVLTTGAVQASETLAHLCIAFAQHDYGNDKVNLDNFISELFRVYPLFGIAHRITSDDIKLPNTDEIISKGTVLCFNYPEFHRRGYTHCNTFDYNRWNKIKYKTWANFIPFGAKNNRPCPAQHISMVWIKRFASTIVDKIEFYTPILHTRSMADGGLCLIVPKKYIKDNHYDDFKGSYYCKFVMTCIWLYKQFTNVTFSMIQLFCGAYMLWDAKRKKLAKTWVEQNALKILKAQNGKQPQVVVDDIQS